MLLEAERTNDTGVLGALELLSVRLGPDKVEQYLLRCAKAQEAWTGVGRMATADAAPGQATARPRQRCRSRLSWWRCASNAVFDVEALRCCQSAYAQWNGKKGMAGRVVIADWLAAPAARRLELLPICTRFCSR